jgi:hypothetical protein
MKDAYYKAMNENTFKYFIKMAYTKYQGDKSG